MTEATGEPGEPKADGRAIEVLSAGVGAFLGVRLGGADGVVVGAASAPLLAELFRRTRDEIIGDRVRRAEEMLQSAAESSGLPPDEFAERAARSERTRFLADAAVKAAAETDWPPSVRAIGRALAGGLIGADDTTIDIPKLVLPAMTEITASQVQVLELMVMSRPRWDGSKTHAERVDDKSLFRETKNKWSAAEITTVHPNLGPALPALLAGLDRRGLIEPNDNTAEALSKYSQNFRSQANRTPPGALRGAARAQNSPPTLTSAAASRIAGVRTWSPTRLGEQVLGYYELAARPDGPPVSSAS
jgi:hypothetical protein